MSDGDGTSTTGTTTTADEGTAALLDSVMNLSSFHRDHERFYASSPRETAVVLQRHARALQGLAARWATAEPSERPVFSPFEGAEDLNDPTAVQLDGVLFMEGEGRPAEIDGMVRSLREAADGFAHNGEWLSQAMEASWAMATMLVEIDGLAGVLGERHRIIATDWEAASMSALIGRILGRAADILDGLDLTPDAVRADLAGGRVLSAKLFSIAELIDHAADLSSDSAGLVHDNGRRWRVFRAQVAEVVAALEPPA